MSHYLFIQSQDPFTETRAARQYELVGDLYDAGHDVTLLLVQNGVTPARQAARSPVFDRLLEWGVPVIADGFSLRQREMQESDLKDAVEIGDVSLAIDALLDGHKVIWN
ncbi:DsrE family protein [Alloalcanivorax mobilis]|uniref:DsrE family protein n=1 Tax=Alloalcanivorax mobilis TaxID=2019569 RepID=UPI000C768EF1|nr:DsrE family protein [Alloalcanivorax mobilis]